MTFSLIFCTLGRSKEVEDFFESLSVQTYNNYEIIVVDQNEDDRVKDIIEPFIKSMKIIYIRTTPGLAKARNIGLKRATGQVVCFPDDDCIYPPVILENIAKFFQNNNEEILMGKTIEHKSGKFVAGKPIENKGIMKCSYFGGSSTTLFINSLNRNKKEILFDEDFGIGATFFAEEENDLVIRLLQSGWHGYYDPEINYVYHPSKDANFSDIKRSKERGYALGALIAKHLFTWCGLSYFVRYNFVRTFGGLVVSVLDGNFIKVKYYWHRYFSIWLGFADYFRLKRIK